MIIVSAVLDPFHYAFVQRGLLEVLLLSAGAGLLGTWIVLLGRRWLATGFDPAFARAAGARSGLPDAALLGLIALGIVAALAAVGALLVTALVVVPAATVRLVTRRLPAWQLASVVLTAAEGVVGLWISVQTNVP